MFQKIIQQNDLLFWEESKGYLAMNYLKLGNIKEYKQALIEIGQGEFKYKAAIELLRVHNYLSTSWIMSYFNSFYIK